MKPSFRIAAATAMLLIAAQSRATTFTHTLKVAGVYDPTTGDLISSDPAYINHAFYSTSALAFRITVYAHLADLPTGQSYGDEAFTVTLSPGLTRPAAAVGDLQPDWIPSNPLTPAFTAAGLPLYAFEQNVDLGPSSTDLNSIFVLVNRKALNHAFDANGNPVRDPRLDLAVDAPLELGSFDVIRSNPTLSSDVSLVYGQFSPIYYTTGQFPMPAINVPDASPVHTVPLFIVPEPTTLALFPSVLAAAALCRRHRHVS